LQTGEQDHRALAEFELDRAFTHQPRQLVVDDLDDLLTGGEALQYLLTERLLAHSFGEDRDDLEVDVRLEQRKSDLAQGARDRLFVEPAAFAEVAEGASEPVGERVKPLEAVY
jgi:hypothetical protein